MNIWASIEPLLNCRSTDELFREFEAFATAQGFKELIYLHWPPVGLKKLGGPIAIFSKGFTMVAKSRYVKEKFFEEDLFVRFCLRTGIPIWWRDLPKYEPIKPQHRTFWKYASEEYEGEGLAIPTYGPNGRKGYIGMNKLDKKPENPDLYSYQMQMYCQVLHIQYCKITRNEREKIKLSNKEKEVMSRVVQGMSTSDIATDMDLSVNTINTHLKRVYTKMNVTDRVSATLFFLGHGYNYD